MFCRWNKAAKASRIAWPGNEIPMFRGNAENSRKLDNLVIELKATCCTKHFGERATAETFLIVWQNVVATSRL